MCYSSGSTLCKFIMIEVHAMDAIRIDRKQAKMVAHRGLSGIELENTCAAFVAAGNRDYWGIETDVHQTADGKFVIFHDDVTGRVATQDIPVELSTFDHLRSLQLKEVRNHDAVRVDLHMPTPEEYFSICKRYNKVAVFELKNPFDEARIEELVAIAKKEIGLENVVFISFFFNNLVLVRKFAPNANCQFLTGKDFSDTTKAKLVEHKIDLDIYHLHVTPELVAEMHEKGILVNCWTVDDPDRAAALVEMGVDFITSNILY